MKLWDDYAMSPTTTLSFMPSIVQMIPYGMSFLYYALLLIFVIYGAFLAYHWYSFGTSKRVSTIALVTYLLGGAFLFIILSLSL